MPVNDSNNDTERQSEPVSKAGFENTCGESFISNVNEKDREAKRWEVFVNTCGTTYSILEA